MENAGEWVWGDLYSYCDDDFCLDEIFGWPWVVLVLIPVLVSIFFAIYRQYNQLASDLSLSNYEQPEKISNHRIIIAISGVHKGTLKALRYARSLSENIS